MKPFTGLRTATSTTCSACTSGSQGIGYAYEAIHFGQQDVMLAGGAPMDGPRYIEWNFVASDKDRIEQAKADWRASIAGGWVDTPFTMPPNEHEYIPLPGDPEAEPQPGS